MRKNTEEKSLGRLLIYNLYREGAGQWKPMKCPYRSDPIPSFPFCTTILVSYSRCFTCSLHLFPLSIFFSRCIAFSFLSLSRFIRQKQFRTHSDAIVVSFTSPRIYRVHFFWYDMVLERRGRGVKKMLSKGRSISAVISAASMAHTLRGHWRWWKKINNFLTLITSARETNFVS